MTVVSTKFMNHIRPNSLLIWDKNKIIAQTIKIADEQEENHYIS